VRAAALFVTVLGVPGCGRSAITAARIETALQTTFANLVELQFSQTKLPAPAFAVTAICRNRQTGSDAGAGEWTCLLVWQGPGREMFRDTYDVVVATDGCYTATAGGEHSAALAVKAPDGSVVNNLLSNFEGCFDTM